MVIFTEMHIKSTYTSAIASEKDELQCRKVFLLTVSKDPGLPDPLTRLHETQTCRPHPCWPLTSVMPRCINEKKFIRLKSFVIGEG